MLRSVRLSTDSVNRQAFEQFEIDRVDGEHRYTTETSFFNFFFILNPADTPIHAPQDVKTQ